MATPALSQRRTMPTGSMAYARALLALMCFGLALSCKQNSPRSEVVRPTAAGNERSPLGTSPAPSQGPQTIEEREAVVVDDNGNSTPVLQKPGESTTNDASGCSKESCFTIKQWSLTRGETYIQVMEGGKLGTFREIGFNNTDLTQPQRACLAETAQALRTYASAHPEDMKPFATDSVSTVFVARLYDTTAVSNRVSPSLYFVAGGDGKPTGANLTTGKWVLRANLYAPSPGKTTCDLPTQDLLAARIKYFSTSLLQNK